MKKAKLIIVEDEPAILKGLESLIGQINLPIQIVGTYLKGQDALDELETVMPDIVLTDVQMPVISGLELISRIKKRGYHAEYLILSSYAEFQYVQQAIKLDVRNYLLKPPMVSELRDSLEAICSKIRRNHYMEFEKILNNLIFQEYKIQEELINPQGNEYRVYLYLLGPYLEWGMEGMDFRPSRWTCECVLKQIEKMTAKNSDNIWVLNGRYPNLKIIISLEDKSYGTEIYLALKQQAEEMGFPATVIVGHICREMNRLHDEVNICMKCLKQKVQFGVSQLYLMDGNEKYTDKMFLQREERDQIYQVLSLNRVDQLVRFYRMLAEKWKKDHCSQAEFVQNTRYILSVITRRLSDLQKTDIEEDTLRQLNVIATQSYCVENFTDKICGLIEEIYENISREDGDNQIENVVDILWAHIHKHFAEDVDVNNFAREYGYHPVYLITQFSKLKGISPTKFLIQRKMSFAKQLLDDTDMTLKEITAAIGYNDVSYFSRAFKEHVGLSPSSYRKRDK